MSPIKNVEGDRIIDLNKRLNEELIKNTVKYSHPHLFNKSVA